MKNKIAFIYPDLRLFLLILPIWVWRGTKTNHTRNMSDLTRVLPTLNSDIAIYANAIGDEERNSSASSMEFIGVCYSRGGQIRTLKRDDLHTLTGANTSCMLRGGLTFFRKERR